MITNPSFFPLELRFQTSYHISSSYIVANILPPTSSVKGRSQSECKVAKRKGKTRGNGDRRPSTDAIAQHEHCQTLESRGTERSTRIEPLRGTSKGDRRGVAAAGAYHVSAVLDGLLGVEGAVLPRDALADHAGALVDEDRRRGHRGGRRSEAPRVEEAGGGGPQQLRRAAGGGGHGGRGAGGGACSSPLPPFFFFLPPSRFDFLRVFGMVPLAFLCLRSTLPGSRNPFLQGKLSVKVRSLGTPVMSLFSNVG